MNRRRWVTAAITVVCALSVLSSPALLNQAYAAPASPTSPSSPAAPSDPPVAPRPFDRSLPPGADGRTAGADDSKLEAVRRKIDGLYGKATSATDAYNLAEERADNQSAELVRLSSEIVNGQVRIDRLKRQAGAAARAQYRAGGLPPEAQLLLTDDPQLFLDGAGRVQRGQKATKDLLGQMTKAQDDLTAYTKKAGAEWTKLEASRVKQAKAKKEITQQIKAAKKIEAGLEKEERDRLLMLEQQDAAKAQEAWLGSGELKDINGEASAQGKAAIEYATAQIGKPYVWGAEGPASFDCSGLTSEAWRAAGKVIPRTSQEQWRLLPRVPVSQMRPGDLIIYHQDASHVGMYVGNGSIVHAPRPGRQVTLTGAGSMVILGVVRPDK
ncbi:MULTISPECIES: C40 family peptidase [Streptomyces]|uniref:C40 family peptidase n=1 Tax=Streptomyces TaxID=1883 RepID=UPI00084C0FB0|nr:MULTISPECIES: NlpC/P60 family protein [Streptomyces]TFI28104.1 NlpC/P60 family protein [Streptomyces sp. 4R-3d]